MWGDRPEDYKILKADRRGLWSVALPTSERLSEDWQVDVIWTFTNASQYAVGCFATGIRFTGEGYRECPRHIDDAATKMAEMLWSRYQANVVKST